MISKLEIINIGYELVEKLTIRPIIDTIADNVLLESMKVKDPPLDWSDKVVGEAQFSTIDANQRIREQWLTNKGFEIGFEENEYFIFKDSCYRISENENFLTASKHFIETTTFEWLTSVKISNQAETDLFNYLRTKLDDVTVQKTFYFEIVNIELDRSFEIGDVIIGLYDRDKYSAHIERMIEKGSSIESIEDAYAKYLRTSVFASITLIGEPEQILSLAKEKVNTAINVLKMLDLVVRFPFRKIRYGLQFKVPFRRKNVHFSEINGELCTSVSFNTDSLQLGHFEIDRKKQILGVFTDFLKYHDKNELNSLVIQAINILGDAFSNHDVHWRCVLLIQTIESLLLKDDQNRDMEQKCKSRLSKVISDNHQEKERIKDDFGHVYQVRHKLIHKARRIQIEEDKLVRCQIAVGSLIISLIERNGIFKTKDDLIDHLNKIAS
jgi:hypothetical protein